MAGERERHKAISQSANSNNLSFPPFYIHTLKSTNTGNIASKSVNQRNLPQLKILNNH